MSQPLTAQSMNSSWWSEGWVYDPLPWIAYVGWGQSLHLNFRLALPGLTPGGGKQDVVASAHLPPCCLVMLKLCLTLRSASDQRRVINMAAAPGEILPLFREPGHVFIIQCSGLHKWPPSGARSHVVSWKESRPAQVSCSIIWLLWFSPPNCYIYPGWCLFESVPGARDSRTYIFYGSVLDNHSQIDNASTNGFRTRDQSSVKL